MRSRICFRTQFTYFTAPVTIDWMLEDVFDGDELLLILFGLAKRGERRRRVEELLDMVRLFVVLAEHFVQDDRVPARQALFDWHEVFPGPAAEAQFLDEIQVRQYAALHDRLPAM